MRDKYLGGSIKIFGIELSFEFEEKYFFWQPHIWKIFPPMGDSFGKYYGMTWAVQIYWLWFTFGIENNY